MGLGQRRWQGWATRSTRWGRRPRRAKGVALAEHLAVPLEIVALEQHAARPAAETVGMELLAVRNAASPSLHGLQILALDPRVAGAAQRVVELVIMLRAVGPVVEDVEVGGSEGNVAVVADKTRPMIAPRQSPVGRGN